MDAKLKKLVINPAVIGKKGEISKDECATLTFEVPLDTMTAKKEVIALFETLSKEFVVLEVDNPQMRTTDEGKSYETKEASINRGQVAAQLETLTGEKR